MKPSTLWTLAGASIAGAAALSLRRIQNDRYLAEVSRGLAASPPSAAPFSAADLRGFPEPAQRYLRHAISPGTPLAAVCQLRLAGTMTPAPGASPTALTADETLAPREGFVWTARARMRGLPVRVRDHYHRGEGGVAVTALGFLPIPLGGDADDIARSSRGRLVSEAVWCPTALVHPDVAWDAVGDDRARFTVTVDGDPVAVTVRVDGDGRLREVTCDRWGDPDGTAPRLHPYGFRADAEGAFDGVTIPTRVTGGWGYGSDTFDPGRAASFTVHRAAFRWPFLS